MTLYKLKKNKEDIVDEESRKIGIEKQKDRSNGHQSEQ